MSNKKLAIIAFLAISVFYLIGSYNGLVTGNQLVDQQWSQVEAQYQRRFDLIPNLVNSTQGFLKQEKQIFKDIADARANYAGARTTDDKVVAGGQLDSALSRLLVISENYPVLKSNETVARLMDELAGTENRISVERSRFNESVTNYNLQVMRFPGNLLANLFGFKSRPLFKSEEKAATVPKVELNQ